MKHAVYADFKRFAVHDGPGIRTVLFLKGCSLACKWCHNPETISPKPELAFYSGKCTGCGACAAVCGNHRISGSAHLLNRNGCSACGKCVEVCQNGALELIGRSIPLDEAVRRLLEDRMFYGKTGGVTFSGGEPLLQADFCAEVSGILKKEHISVAVDTCGNVPWSAFEKMLPYTDIFLYDLKAADPEKHRKYTSADNALLLENLRKLSAAGKKIEIRMPMIPQWNMEESDLRSAAEILSGLKHVSAVRLLAYHSLARSKYAAVGRPDSMPEVDSPNSDDLKKCAKILRGAGLRVIYG